jgi:hypothetical protein
VQMSKRKVKMNQPMRYSPKELRNGSGDSASRVDAIWNPPGVRMIAVPIQKPPYEERAVAPKVLPRATSLLFVRFIRCRTLLYNLDLPHACEKLYETAVRESSANNDVGLGETASTQVNA